jgi:hypothetical protein
MRRLLAILFLLASPAVAQLCSESFNLRVTACPAGALDCTNKGSTLTHAELDADIINTVNICKPFDVTSTAIDVEGDWTFIGAILVPAASFDGDDLAASIAGDHLTLEAASPDVINVDAELKTFDHCWQRANPETDEEWYAIWRAPTAVEITEIYCEVTGGTSVALDLEIDDGGPDKVNGSDIVCDVGGQLDDSLGGTTAMADGYTMDVDFGAVTGEVTQLSVCFEYTVDD